jgi:cytochrome P450
MLVLLVALLCLLVVFVTSGLLVKYLKAVYKNYRKYCHIPGVTQFIPVSLFRIPIIAPYIFLGAFKQFPALSKKFRQYPLIRFTIGNQTLIALNSVSALKHVLLKKHKYYEKPVETYTPIKIFGENIVSLPGGDLHKLHRTIVEPIFSDKSLRNVCEVALQSTKLLLSKLHSISGNDNQCMIEVNSDMTDLTMDIIARATFGVDFYIFDEHDVNAKHTKFDTSRHTMSFYDALHIANTVGMLMKGFFPLWIQQSFVFSKVQRAIREVDQYLSELVDERTMKNDTKERNDLLTLFLQCNEVNDKQMTISEIKSDAFIFLFAGKCFS